MLCCEHTNGLLLWYIIVLGCGYMKDRILDALKSVHRALGYEEIDYSLISKFESDLNKYLD